MELLKKFNYIFSTRQKVQSVFLCLGLFLGALMELVGVSLIAQLVELIGKPETIETNALMRWLYTITGADSANKFFLYFSLISFFTSHLSFALQVPRTSRNTAWR